MIKPRGDCKGCHNRKVGCHATCKLYEKYRDDLERYNEIIKREKDKDKAGIVTFKER